VIWRSLKHPAPLIDMVAFLNRDFAAGCCFSFSLGMGLYGAAYLLPVLLGLIRNYDALAIGEFIMVTGAAQLVMVPVASNGTSTSGCLSLPAMHCSRSALSATAL
jgi:MFS transporter, DHA2 family, multidrug resistance protein